MDTQEVRIVFSGPRAKEAKEEFIAWFLDGGEDGLYSALQDSDIDMVLDWDGDVFTAAISDLMEDEEREEEEEE